MEVTYKGLDFSGLRSTVYLILVNNLAFLDHSSFLTSPNALTSGGLAFYRIIYEYLYSAECAILCICSHSLFIYLRYLVEQKICSTNVPRLSLQWLPM